MEIEIIGDAGTDPTDTPRDLSPDEAACIVAAGRLNGIKIHRQLTSSTLPAAIRAVDQLLAAVHS
jgi:hypothetical protein